MSCPIYEHSQSGTGGSAPEQERSANHPVQSFAQAAGPQRPPISGRAYLAEFRELLIEKLMTGAAGLSQGSAGNVAFAVTKLGRFLADVHRVEYCIEREQIAFQALKDGVLLSDSPPGAKESVLELIIRSGRSGAQQWFQPVS
ncbi:MAG: hypothetical protein EBZ48_05100 [Proteobacteria bacterium]|nr:hypothetical protein [Pseudomonadota bacterium]